MGPSNITIRVSNVNMPESIDFQPTFVALWKNLAEDGALQNEIIREEASDVDLQDFINFMETYRL